MCVESVACVFVAAVRIVETTGIHAVEAFDLDIDLSVFSEKADRMNED